MPLPYAFADVVVGGFGAPNGLGAGVEGDKAGALKMFTFCCLPYAFADVVVGGFCTPNGLGAGVEGDKAGALKIFTFCCLNFVYVVVALFSFRCFSYPDLSVGGVFAPEWSFFRPLNILEGFLIIRLDTLHGEVITAGLVGFGAPDGLGAESAEGFGAPGGLGAEGALKLFSCFL